MVADQIDKADIFQRGSGDLAFAFFHQFQLLHLTIAHRDDHAAWIGQLSKQRLRDLRPAGRDQDAVKGGLVRPADGAVIDAGDNVELMKAVKDAPGADEQGIDAFNGEDSLAEPGEHGGLVTGTGTDLEDPFRAGQPQGLGHQGNDIGLGNGLAAADGQRMVAIGTGAEGIIDKLMPGHGAHGLQGEGIGYAARDELLLDHPLAVNGKRPAHLTSFHSKSLTQS